MDKRVRILDDLRNKLREAHTTSERKQIKDEMCKAAEGRCDLCRYCGGWKVHYYMYEWPNINHTEK